MPQKRCRKPHNPCLCPPPIPQIRLGFEGIRDNAGCEDGWLHAVVFAVFALGDFIDFGLGGEVEGVCLEVRLCYEVGRRGGEE